jgi:antitoxin component YwqK of YwqJK toxin-antitoxin module
LNTKIFYNRQNEKLSELFYDENILTKAIYYFNGKIMSICIYDRDRDNCKITNYNYDYYELEEVIVKVKDKYETKIRSVLKISNNKICDETYYRNHEKIREIIYDKNGILEKEINYDDNTDNNNNKSTYICDTCSLL